MPEVAHEHCFRHFKRLIISRAAEEFNSRINEEGL